MAMFYGYRWLNSFGEADDGTWLAGLCDVTPGQILHGIDAVRVSGKDWPPTLPEFRRMCLPPKLPPYYNCGATLKDLRLTQAIDWDKLQKNWREKVVAICRR